MSTDELQLQPSELFYIARRSAPYRTQLLARLGRELALQVHEVLVADASPNRPQKSSRRTRGARGGFRLCRSLRRAWKARRRIVAARDPFVIVHGYDHAAFVLVMVSCRLRGIPVFLRADSNILGESGKSAVLRAVKRAYLLVVRWIVDGVMTVGTGGSEYYKEYGFAPDRIFCVPFEIDHDWFGSSPTERELDVFRSTHGLHDARQYVIFPGRLEPVKNPSLAIGSFLEVASEFPNWDLLVAGSGSLLGELTDLVPPEQRRRVVWLGWCSQSDLRCAYFASDLLLLPSHRDAWAVVVNESITAGLVPVVSDQVGAASDLIDNGLSGIVFRSDDYTAAASGLALAMGLSAEQRTTFAERGAARYEEFRRRNDPVVGVQRAIDSTITR